MTIKGENKAKAKVYIAIGMFGLATMNLAYQFAIFGTDHGVDFAINALRSVDEYTVNELLKAYQSRKL